MTLFRKTLLAALMAPAFALAQASPQPAQPQEKAPQGEIGMAGKAAVSGHVRGAITRVDYGMGTLTVALGGGESMVLRGTPAQLSNFKRGAVADLSYDKFGDSRWLSAAEGQSAQLGGNFARTTTVTGAVSSINKADGTLTLALGSGQSATFEAHPDTIKSLVPGQFISLTYDRVAQHNWVKSLGEGGSSEPGK